MVISTEAIISGLTFLGMIVGVWMRAEVAIAKLTQRMSSNEKQQNINDTYVEKELHKFEQIIKEQYTNIMTEIKSINSKISDMEISIVSNKAINKNGDKH